VFFANDIFSNWVETGLSMSRVLDEFSSVMASKEFLSERMRVYLLGLGPVGVKVMGFLLNISQIEQWWVLGYGFGSSQRPSQVVSNTIQYDAPRIIQLFFLKSGLVVRFLVVFILIRATLLSLRYDSLKYYSVGITAWSLFPLNSWEVWPLVLVVILVFKIFSYGQMQRSSIAGKHRSPHLCIAR
jgi:hypothetical protein